MSYVAPHADTRAAILAGIGYDTRKAWRDAGLVVDL